ncbi:MAG: DUF2007 domain-containing protein [Bacillota bacterium]|nr:DUF2007 domain-containing protein [Bacillota bacterium]MDD3297747.1 DUF2007 domain-containing protein [Bacillota bacterium]MDD3850082.1 DUF2007 domain-containing protein [Bacillota bacterium]MDD4706680.1 DUF2007 domain-containing protein [Bacillota bacterium]
MPWCPECKTEYREGFDVCVDCGCALTQDEPFQDTPEQPGERGDWEHLVFLYSEMEADIVRGLLETAGIPVIKTYKGMGVLHKVYTGKATGVDLYVPAERLVQAKELLEAGTKD